MHQNKVNVSKIKMERKNLFREHLNSCLGFNPRKVDISLTSAAKKLLARQQQLPSSQLQTLTNIQFLKDIRSYRGVRHKCRLPVRGQRTHTNARTSKKKKKFV